MLEPPLARYDQGHYNDAQDLRRRASSVAPSPITRIVIGGGAGGLELATRLGNRHARDATVEVTLVDSGYSHLWKPLLHEVAAGTLNSSSDALSYLAQAHWHQFQFRLGALLALDRHAKTVTIAASHDRDAHEYIPQRVLPYTCLVRDCYFADAHSAPVRPGQPHIAIGGAGATGVELAAELHHSLHTLVGFGLDKSLACWRRGEALPAYVYKDFGSLISLSTRRAIGSLMGNLFGRHPSKLPIEGLLARWAYLSLYKMHQVAVQGWLRTVLNTLADRLTRSNKPRLKLH